MNYRNQELHNMLDDLMYHIDSSYPTIADVINDYGKDAAEFFAKLSDIINNLRDKEDHVRLQLTRSKLMTKMLTEVANMAQGHEDAEMTYNLKTAITISSSLVKKLTMEWERTLLSSND